MENIILLIKENIWGVPTLSFLFLAGLYCSYRVKFLQFFRLKHALRLIFSSPKKDSQGDISVFSSLMTMLGGAIGTGNLVGVALALKIGGPGAIFWMWVFACFGMVLRYFEGILAIKYRHLNRKGEISGGPMYYITYGLGQQWKKLAAVYATCAFFAVGIGSMVQSNTIAGVLRSSFQVQPHYTGIVLTLITAVVILGGIKKIAILTDKLVPTMSIAYFLSCCIVILYHVIELPSAFLLIFTNAFHPGAATGGVVGISFIVAVKTGVSRAVFSSGAALGTPSIHAAAAQTDSPVEQGLVCMLTPFFDTLVLCTLTGITLLVTGVWNQGVETIDMVKVAFETLFSTSVTNSILVSCILLFCFSSILFYAYVGEKCVEYLFTSKSNLPFRMIFTLTSYFGCAFTLKAIWGLVDISYAVLALLNVFVLLKLSPIVLQETKTYFQKNSSESKGFYRETKGVTS